MRQSRFFGQNNPTTATCSEWAAPRDLIEKERMQQAGLSKSATLRCSASFNGYFTCRFRV